MAVRSEHLTDHDGCDRGKHSDAKSGERVLPLCNGHCCDDSCAQASHTELGGEIVWALQCGLASPWTVGSAEKFELANGFVCYAASGFVTCSNRCRACPTC